MTLFMCGRTQNFCLLRLVRLSDVSLESEDNLPIGIKQRINL